MILITKPQYVFQNITKRAFRIMQNTDIGGKSVRHIVNTGNEITNRIIMHFRSGGKLDNTERRIPNSRDVSRFIFLSAYGAILSLYQYAQLPSPGRVNQAWAAALVLMAIVLFVNIIVRIYITISTARLKG